MDKQKTAHKETYFKIKDYDDKKRTVDIVVSSWSKDKHSDRILKGAYNDIIKGFKITPEYKTAHCLNHDMSKCIGMPIEMEETEEGLRIVSRLSNSTLGRDAFENYKIDMYQHSVFIMWKSEDEEYDNENEETVIKKISYMPEYSAVLHGANDRTPTKGLAEKSLAQNKKELDEYISDKVKDILYQDKLNELLNKIK